MSASGPGAVVDDGHGYHLTSDDLAFLQISDTSLAAWLTRQRPLGMTANQFEHFARTLSMALDSDGITQANVRLQGSSAKFFSGPHKPMPYTRDEAAAEFRRNRDRVPEPFEIDDALEVMGVLWAHPDHRPYRRPFDAMYRLGLDKVPSDYDVQISSSQMVRRARSRITDLGIDPSDLVVHNQHYDFVRKDLIEDTCPALHLWGMKLSDIVRRNVTVAVFDDQGPPEAGTELSSHFRDDDWVLHDRRSTP